MTTECAVDTLVEPKAAARPRLTLALVASGMFMAVLDTTIVNVALPALRATLGASVSGLAWIVDAYTLSFAALILAGGVASDRFGAKAVYLWGLALFVAASAACGLAPNVGALVAARFVQGTGAALFLPASLAIVRSTFDDPVERARAIAVWATIASVAASVGPVLGGHPCARLWLAQRVFDQRAYGYRRFRRSVAGRASQRAQRCAPLRLGRSVGEHRRAGVAMLRGDRAAVARHGGA